MEEEKKRLIRATKSGDLETVKDILKENPQWLPSVWFHAALQGYLPIVQYAVKCGINVDIKNEDKETAIYLAVSNGYLDIVKYLIEQKADLGFTSRHDTTLLITAIQNGYDDIAKTLIQAKASMGYRQGHTSPLLHAIAKDMPDVVDLMLKEGVYADERGAVTKLTAFLFAAQNGNMVIMKRLLEAGADVKAVSKDGDNALMLATASSNIEAIKYLLSLNFNVDDTNKNSETALMFAAGSKRTEAMKILFAAKKNISLESDQDYQWAKKSNCKELLALFEQIELDQLAGQKIENNITVI